MVETVADFVGELRHLAAGQDQRAVKRAYAKALKVIRPDEDAAGFQQLNEAYQAALAYMARNAQPGIDDEPQYLREALDWPDTDEPSRAAPRPAPALDAVDTLQAPALDAGGFARSVVEQATRATPEALAQWLSDHPELWSLHDKPRIGYAVLERLQAIDAPLHEDTFDTLAACFGWNELGSGIDPVEALECRARLYGLWQFRQDAASQRVLLRASAWQNLEPVEEDPRLARLRRPWNRPRALLSASIPGRAHGMDEFIARVRVQAGHIKLQPRQVEFWLALCRPREVNAPKLQLATFRSALLGGAFAVFLLGLGLADGMAGGHWGYWSYAWPALIGCVGLLLGGSLILPLRGFVQWQTGAEHPRQRMWIVRLLVIPVLSLIALWIMRETDARPWGLLLAWPVAALALARLVARGPFRVALSPWMIGLAVVLIPALKFSLAVLAVGELAVAAALLMWATDAVNHVSLAHAPRRKRGAE